MRVLIADDHDLIRKGIRTLLCENASVQVCGEARTGAEAVRKCAELKPDVTILHFNMPELNGLDAARQIRDLSPETEILMVTIDRSEELTYALMASSVRGYILKQDCGQELLKALGALEHRRPYFTSVAVELILDSNGQRGATPSPLTPREQDILRLIADGQTNPEIGKLLSITSRTVDAHRYQIMKKLDMHATADLVRYALRNHLVNP